MEGREARIVRTMLGCLMDMLKEMGAGAGAVGSAKGFADEM